MAMIRLVPSAYYLSNSSYLRVADVDNMYDNTDSTTHGTFTHNRNSTSNTYYAYLRGFNFDDVPSNATVTGFTIKLKASATGHTTSTSSSYQMSLSNGTTQIGNTYASGRLSTSVQIFTFSVGSLDWNDLVNYGSNFSIRIPLRRASSGTADVVSVYGAEIEVTYTIPNPRTLNVSSSGSGTVTPSGSSTVYDGDEVEVVISPTNKSDTVTATHNGTDVTSQLVAHGAGSTKTFTANDVQLTDIQSGSQYAEYAIGYTAEDPHSSTSNMYASSTGHADYSFDFSSIPANAVIEDIEVRCHGHRESATIDSTHISRVTLYRGSTAISDDEEFQSQSSTTVTLVPTDMPTRAELDDVVVRHLVGYYGGLVTGISFVVTYSTGSGLDHYTYTFTVSGDATIAVSIGGQGEVNTAYIKIDDVWKNVQVSEKPNGSWQQISDPTTVIDTIQKYYLKS